MLRAVMAVVVVALLAGGVWAGAMMFLPSTVPLIATWGASDVPAEINHQGVISVSGVRFEGNGKFKFALVRLGEPETVVWTNDGNTPPDAWVELPVIDGVYSVRLGNISLMNAISRDLFSDGDLRLRIWFWDSVNDPAQLEPDHVLSSAPYALTVADEAVTKAKLDPSVAKALVPAGAILPYGGSSAPPGWLLCDGAAVSRTDYAALFGAIATTYGVGDGSTTFNLPNLKGRIPVGVDAGQGEFDSLGETGGARTHTLSESEMPTHTHTQDSHNHTQNSHNHSQDSHNHSQDSHSHNIACASNAGIGGGGSYIPHNGGGSSISGINKSTTATNNATTATNNATTATNQAKTATNQNTGGGAAHNNLQPYLVMNYIVKH